MGAMTGVRFAGCRRGWLAAAFLIGGDLLAAGCSDGFTVSALMLDVSADGYQATLIGAGCPTLGDVSVTFDGLPGQVLAAGGTTHDLYGGTHCESAQLGLARTISFAQATPRTEMTISGSTTVHAVFTQMIGPVTMNVVGSPPLTPGSMVTVALDPASDVFVAAGVGPKLRWDTPGGIVSARDAQISGGMITATIPATVSAGDQLAFSYGQGIGVIQAATEVCEGAPACIGYPQVLVEPVQITVQ